MQKVAEILVGKMRTHSLIDSSDSKIYEYGIKNLIYIGINLLWAIGFAVYFGKCIELLVFLFTFIILRSYAGGLHCKRKFCLILSNIIVLLPIFVEIKNNFVSLLCVLISIVEIAFFSPMENQNKKMSMDEEIRYRKTVHITLAVCLCILIIMLSLGYFRLYSSMGVAIILVCLLQILNIFKENTVKKLKGLMRDKCL